jgi:hypothetical protein
MHFRGLLGPAPHAYVLFMIDGRTALAKHTKWVGLLLFGLLALTIVLEALG